MQCTYLAVGMSGSGLPFCIRYCRALINRGFRHPGRWGQVGCGLEQSSHVPREAQHLTLSLLFYILFCRKYQTAIQRRKDNHFSDTHEGNTSLLCTRLRGTICNTLLARYDIDSFLVLKLFKVMNVLLVAQRPQCFLSPLSINGL